MKKFIITSIGIMFTLFILSIFIVNFKIKKDDNYLKELNLNLVGQVEQIKYLKQGHDFGVILINIIETNKDSYDERNTRERYFGVIKNNKAAIAVSNISSFEKGDVFMLSGLKYKILRKEKIVKENFYGIPSNIFSPFNEIDLIIESYFSSLKE